MAISWRDATLSEILDHARTREVLRVERSHGDEGEIVYYTDGTIAELMYEHERWYSVETGGDPSEFRLRIGTPAPSQVMGQFDCYKEPARGA